MASPQPSGDAEKAASSSPHLTRGFGLLQATALNMSNMVGVGPFITIPLLMASMGGPQALLGWFVGAAVVISDGLVWSELGAALPGSGGSYRYLREAYGPDRWGRLMAFLFIWQFVLSGPLEIASGLIGFGQYASYLWPGLAGGGQKVLAAGVGLLAVVLLARRITFLARVTVTLWAGTVLTLVAVLATGLPRFSAARAFDFPPGAFDFGRGFVLGLGSAALVAVYDYLGYYDVCYIGDEVRDPARVIPRSILISIGAIFVTYLLLHLSLIGSIPWRETLGSQFVISEFMEKLHGRAAAVAVTVMILWTAFGSVFALLLGYSRIPYAAAVQGDFFRPFARLHPQGNFPHVSLYVLGGVSAVAAFFSLDAVIKALITTRVLVQFLGQIVALPLLRKHLPDSARPYRMWLYPLPALVAFLGWAYIFLTSGWIYIAVGVATLLLGVGAFLLRARVERTWPFAAPALAGALALALVAGPAQGAERVVLDNGWALQSSAQAGAAGDALSKPGYATSGWQAVTVPNTVVGALVENGTWRDPFFGMNLRQLPGMSYPVAKNFSHLPMADDSPFKRSWWYRREFTLPAASEGRRTWLHFNGINYRANVWLNGERVAAAKDVAGAFRRYAFDVTRQARRGAVNALAVEVFAPEVTELAFNWVDWNPMPPDKNMGLWGEVWLDESGPLVVRHPQVVSRLALPALDAADLTVSAEVWNAGEAAVTGTLRGAIENVRFERALELLPGQRATVRFTPVDVPGLHVTSPRLWWPYRLGAQEMYTLSLSVEAAGAPSDGQDLHFGIQQMESELTPEGNRLFKVNGQPLLVRGGGWSSDMLLRLDPQRLETEMRYVRDMGLNTIRLEGKLEHDTFYELADRYGILVLAGWCCCDHWEEWQNWDGEDHWVAAESLRDQSLRLRNHPSVLAWLNGSDNPPPADVERAYLTVLRETSWPKPVVSNATEKSSSTGPSGVKMRGPYDYVPPAYWLRDEKNGGAHGFATEITGGMAVPPAETIQAVLPRQSWWPMDEAWRYHAGSQEFADMDLYNQALSARYGAPTSLEDYTRKAQAMAYEAHRAMFEGYARNKYRATGVIQWMLNNAWPSLIWHLYDYALRPAGAYYGTKQACRPLHVQYSYDDRTVVVVDDRHRQARGLKVTATLLDLALKPRFKKDAVVDVPADGVVRAFALPDVKDLTTTYFLRLELSDADGRALGSNFYWLSTRDDVMQWEKSTWYHTPVSQHADLTGVTRLPRTSLSVAARLQRASAQPSATVTVQNTGRALAFMVRLKMTDGRGGKELLPVLWEDNYFPLMPGEKRTVTVSFPAGTARPVAEAEAWNAPAVQTGG